jgi:cysteinyl-tRNA synthetase
MAKSKGHYYLLNDVLARGYDPREVRFLLLSTHYRKMLNFTFEALDQARASRNRIRDFLVDLRDVKREGAANPEVSRLIEKAQGEFVAALEDDLNISEALAALFSLIEKANGLMAKARISQADAMDLRNFVTEIDKKILMIEPTSAYLKVDSAKIALTSDNAVLKVDVSGELDSAIQKKVEERQKARAERNFKLADEIRKELLDQGILLEDTKDGVRWKKVRPARS